jgi:hypothetical protein
MQSTTSPLPRQTCFVFAKILDNVNPLERAKKYEDPLEGALKEGHLGEVTGGGTMQNKDGSIKWVGVDIELVDLSAALAFTKMKLRSLGAPKGSVVEFERDGVKVTEAIHED